MTDFSEIVSTTAQSYRSHLVFFAILTITEFAFVRQRQALGCRLSGVMIWLAYVPISVLIYKGLYFLWDKLGVEPLVTLSLISSLDWAGPAAVVLAAISGALIADFLLYWYHRAQHRYLWRFHAVHHSVRDLNAVNSYHHASEALFSGVLVALPTTLIVVDYGPTLPLLVFLTSIHAIYLHSPTTINAGPLRAIFGDNVWHRIHHSIDPKHYDKNFGVLTTFWDRIFGTAYFPRSDEWPDVGIVGTPQPSNILEWLLTPIRPIDTSNH